MYISPNGVGKTTLLKLIMNQLELDGGELWKGTNVEIGYYDQEQTNLNPEKTIVDEIWDENPHFDRYTIMSLMARFLFFNDDLEKKIKTLSGGEKGRLSLMKLMLSNANFLILDEPTNHLDIESKEVLENALIDYTGTILTISHDRYFLNKISNKIFDLQPTGLSEYIGNFDYYLEKKAILEKNEPEVKSENKSWSELKDNRKKEKDFQKKLRSLKKSLEKIETEIATTEESIEEINENLCLPEVYNDHEKSYELNNKLENLNTELESLYEKWEIVHEELNEFDQ